MSRGGKRGNEGSCFNFLGSGATPFHFWVQFRARKFITYLDLSYLNLCTLNSG